MRWQRRSAGWSPERGPRWCAAGWPGSWRPRLGARKRPAARRSASFPGTIAPSPIPISTTSLTTGMGHARNLAVVSSGDAVIAIGGGYGTLSEIGLAAKIGRPVVILGGWRLRTTSGAKECGTRSRRRRLWPWSGRRWPPAAARDPRSRWRLAPASAPSAPAQSSAPAPARPEPTREPGYEPAARSRPRYPGADPPLRDRAGATQEAAPDPGRPGRSRFVLVIAVATALSVGALRSDGSESSGADSTVVAGSDGTPRAGRPRRPAGPRRPRPPAPRIERYRLHLRRRRHLEHRPYRHRPYDDSK